MTDSSAKYSLIQPISELFSKSVSQFWATTYNIDLMLFNEFLLSRLGDPPLNIVVLADYKRLTSTLERIPSERIDTLASVNRRWLLRGVLLGSQAFHAKSYLAISGKHTVLLVGSGNLSSDGINDGHEVFTIFRSGTPAGDSALAIWIEWMRRLVEMVGDVMLASRFQHLNEHFLDQPLTSPSKLLLHNLDEPISDQMISIVRTEVTGSIDELLLTAPFYDADANAVARLLSDLKPRRVRIYVTRTSSVNGNRLREKLANSGAQIEVMAYEPDSFVHAKLIGIRAGQKGWLISGSANLSQAALTRNLHNGGNIELAVISRIESSQISDLFVPLGMVTMSCDLDSLNSLFFHPGEEDAVLTPIHLISANSIADGRIEVNIDSPTKSGWLLDDMVTSQPLSIDSNGRIVTVGTLNGRLVQIVDEDGNKISNRVIVDDSNSLSAVLMTNTEATDFDIPSELITGDLNTPLGQALAWLNQNLIMDVTERLAKMPTGGVAPGEADQQSDDDLWERLEHEQLVRDPRISTYARIWNRNLLNENNPIIEIIDILRARTPKEPISQEVSKSLLRHLLYKDDLEDEQNKKPSHHWRISARIRIRALNVLRRWANAQTDERLLWVDPLAPVSNLAMIMGILAELQIERADDAQRVELTEEDLNDLWLRWLKPFVGSGKAEGWLDQLDQDNLELALERLPEWVPEVSAALCWFAVRPGSNRTTILEWQPIITSALKHGLLDPTEMTALYISTINKAPVTQSQVDDHLLSVIEFIDDILWCDQTKSELGLTKLELNVPPLGASYLQIRIDVCGIPDPLLDPRVPRLIVEARNYRRCDGVALYASDPTWRIVTATGKKIAYLPGLTKATIESSSIINPGVIERLSSTGGVLATLFPSIIAA